MSQEEQGNHLEQSTKELAQFLAEKERLRDRMALASAEMHTLRSLVQETKKSFNTKMQNVQAQAASSKSKGSDTSKKSAQSNQQK